MGGGSARESGGSEKVEGSRKDPEREAANRDSGEGNEGECTPVRGPTGGDGEGEVRGSTGTAATARIQKKKTCGSGGSLSLRSEDPISAKES